VREVWVLPWVLLSLQLMLQPASVIDAYLPLLVGVVSCACSLSLLLLTAAWRALELF